jgi:hypothetical protein
VSWRLVTDDWRLKLLALGLAVLMLGAVAFSQNPPTAGSLMVKVVYTPGPNIILINPPTKLPVSYSGLANVIRNVNSSNTLALVDARQAHAGSAVRLNVTASSIPGVIVQNPPPIVVDIDTLQVKDLTPVVNVRPAPGWAVTKAFAECPGVPCSVHFTGPASWENNLTASVTVPGQINFTGPAEVPNLLVQLANGGGAVDLTCRTIPCATLDTTSVAVHIEAAAGSTVTRVPLVDAPPSHGPANGYRITAITISPNTVVITGDPVTLGKVHNIVLPAIDLSGRTSDYTVQVTIPYDQFNVTGQVATATIKYSISPNPNVSPSPGS